MTLAISATKTALAYPRLDWRSADFESRRVIAESAWQTEAEAQQRGEELHYEYGFRNLGVLWIPYYRNLSGKRLYQTIIIPEGNCDRFLRQHIRRLDRNAYCFTPSNRGLAPNRRGA
ncbi:MAG: hypothetical protein EA001_11270 [Oscillatoriales cyanobacterium]|nr:MAG: hypothetical protein EA001_11270 [Oscillatoriales cyanobacterium]